MKRQSLFAICAILALVIGFANVSPAIAAPALAAAPGTVVGWGYNGQGQTNVPTGLSNVTAIAASWAHSLALKSDGTVVASGCGGFTNYGQCIVPAALSNVTAIAAGGAHSLALKSDGTVVGWGNNGWGQTNIPTGLNNVTAIAASWGHSLALKSDGTVVAWGENSFGRASVPVSLNNVAAIAAGFGHNLALKSDGTVVAWGYNGQGAASVPAELSEVTAIAAGYSHSLALKSDGTVVGWGYNYNGQSSVPVGLNNVTAITAGRHHSLALKSDGTVVAWGCGGFTNYGQCIVPAALSNVTAIAAGYDHSLALVPSDTTPPVIAANVVGTPGNNGWYVSDVTVSWNTVDDESAISSQSGCNPTTLSSDTAGTTLTCSATSTGGTASQSLTIKLDKTAPTVDAGPVLSILQGESYMGAGTFSDPSAGPWTATVDYGDDSGVQSLALAGNTFTLDHVYTAAGIFTVGVTVTDEAGNVGTAPIIVTVLTPQEGIQDLIGQVQNLIDQDVLNGGPGNALIVKLQAAIQQLNGGKVETALNQLESFIKDVDADIRSGKLTLEEGQPLLDAANAIIDALGG